MTATWSLDVRGDVLYVGQTAGLDDPSAPIYTMPVPMTAARGGLNLECPTCPGRVTVHRGGDGSVGGPLDGHDFESEPLIIVEHADGCESFELFRWLWLKEAGR